MMKRISPMVLLAAALVSHPSAAAPRESMPASLGAAFDHAWDDVVSGAEKVKRAGDLVIERAADGAVVAWRSVEKAGRSAGERVDDVATLTEIKGRLASDPSTSARAIGVNVYHGEVTLQGEVRSSSEAKTATRLALQTSGVHRVVSHLRWPGMTSAPTQAP